MNEKAKAMEKILNRTGLDLVAPKRLEPKMNKEQFKTKVEQIITEAIFGGDAEITENGICFVGDDLLIGLAEVIDTFITKTSLYAKEDRLRVINLISK